VRRLLVTGGAGFIGSNFVHHWLRQHPGDRIVVLDALTYAGNLDNLTPVAARPELRFVRGDIRDTVQVASLLREEAIETLVNFAAESHVDRSISGPDAFIDTNVLGTHSLLKAARQVWIDERAARSHRFHHVSTDEVYGSLGESDPSFTEKTAYAPNSPYSASKAASDHLVRAYARTYGLAVTITNCSNNYGPYQFPEKLIPLAITNILRGIALPLYGDGLNVRDWLHVDDHCRAIDLVLDRGQVGEVYNVGGGTERDNLSLVRTLCAIGDELLGSAALKSRYPACPAARREPCASLIRFVEDRPGHDRRYSIDGTKMERQLGFLPSTSLDQGLRRTFEWYLENQSWVESVLDQSYRQRQALT
jgi:dTDP-glucose 4,6-dehydratase